MVTTAKFTNLQLELIKMFSIQLQDNQLVEVRDILTKYFAEKATDEMDKLWTNSNWDDDTMERWADEHLRTAYKH